MSQAKRFTRYLRVAAGSYEPPPVDCTAEEGHFAAHSAEASLQDAVEAGYKPSLALVALERGTKLEIHPNGTINDTFGWRDEDRTAADEQFIAQHAAVIPSVILTIESDDYEPDPHSDEFATHGSCLIRTGRIVAASAANWLAPVLPELEAMLGVEVELRPGRHRSPKIAPAPPVMVQGVLGDGEIADLIAHHRRHPPSQLTPASPELVFAPTEGDWGAKWFHYAALLGQTYQLPVDKCFVFILRYFPGAGQDWHIDNSPRGPSSGSAARIGDI